MDKIDRDLVACAKMRQWSCAWCGGFIGGANTAAEASYGLLNCPYCCKPLWTDYGTQLFRHLRQG